MNFQLRASLALLISALALAVGISGAWATHEAGAAAPRSFFGLNNSYRPPTASDATRIQNAGVGVFRRDLNWRTVEPRPPDETGHHYDWRKYDAIFRRIAERGVRVMPVIVTSPRWVRGTVQFPPQTEAEHRAFKAFVGAAVRRYGPRGSFWRGKSVSRSVRAWDWQIWNEPNLGQFWNNQPDAREYARLLKAAGRAVHGADPDARVIAAGVARDVGQDPRRFLGALFSINGVSSATDAFAIHPYGWNPRDVVTYLGQLRSALAGTSGGSKPMWVTEIGWGTGGLATPMTVGGGWLGYRRQAEYLREAYRELLRVREAYRIRGAVWFNLNDRRPGTYWFYNAGLFDVRGNAKPSWGAMRCVTAARMC